MATIELIPAAFTIVSTIDPLPATVANADFISVPATAATVTLDMPIFPLEGVMTCAVSPGVTVRSSSGAASTVTVPRP